MAREFPKLYLAHIVKKPSRPRDVNQLAKMVGDLATKQVEEPSVTRSVTAASKRGDARAAALTPRKRKAIAKKAATARWKPTK